MHNLLKSHLFALTLSVACLAAAAPRDEVVEQRWAAFMSNPGGPPDSSYPFRECFRQAAKETGLPLALLLAVARGESNFDHRARSSAGALGLMQILWPGTARHLGIDRREALFDPCTNVAAGARYLNELLGRYQGDLHRALAAYNYGPGRVSTDPSRPLPRQASWYSGYIQGHLQRVLQGSAGGGRGWVLIRFERPYRAAAFVDRLQPLLGEIPLEWFRRPDGRFEVVVRPGDEAQTRRARRILLPYGFEI